MAHPFDAVEAARSRCKLLLHLLTAAKTRALSDPTGNYTVDMGIIARGDKKADAVAKVNRVFEELDGLLAHVTLIDMTASLEKAFSSRLGTAVGEARKTLREGYNLGAFQRVHESLVRDAEDFQGLAGIEKLLSSQMSEELKDALRVVRSERNKFAHGTDVSVPPLINADEAFDALKVIADLAF
jgi:hypothetical protein